MYKFRAHQLKQLVLMKMIASCIPSAQLNFQVNLRQFAHWLAEEILSYSSTGRPYLLAMCVVVALSCVTITYNTLSHV